MQAGPTAGNSPVGLRFASKQAIALAVLACAALWPGLHFALYRNYGIDPWRLCGWAMYARPRSAQQLSLFTLQGDGATQVSNLPPQLRQRTEAAIARRGALGELTNFDDIAPDLLAAFPRADGIRLVLRRTDFDCRSGRLDKVGEYTRAYWREGASVAGSPTAPTP